MPFSFLLLPAINEVKLLSSLSTQFVVKYFDSFIEEGSLNIVMVSWGEVTFFVLFQFINRLTQRINPFCYHIYYPRSYTKRQYCAIYLMCPSKMIQEFCDKGDLAGLLRRARDRGDQTIPEDRIWSIFAQCLSGLNYLHSRRVLHRDMKVVSV